MSKILASFGIAQFSPPILVRDSKRPFFKQLKLVGVNTRAGEGQGNPSEGTAKCPAGCQLHEDCWFGDWTNNLYLHTSTHTPVRLRQQKGRKLMLASWREMMDECREIHWEQHLQHRLILVKLGMLTGLLFVFWSVQLGLAQCSFFMIVLRCTNL